MERGEDGCVEQRLPVSGAKHQVHDDEAQGLWHGDGAGFQPFVVLRSDTWGIAPGWDGGAPLALSYVTVRRICMSCKYCFEFGHGALSQDGIQTVILYLTVAQPSEFSSFLST